MTQIQIPSELPNILRNFTLSVLRNRPSNIIDHAVDYFTRLQQEEHRTDPLKKNQSEQAVSSSGDDSSANRQQSMTTTNNEESKYSDDRSSPVSSKSDNKADNLVDNDDDDDDDEKENTLDDLMDDEDMRRHYVRKNEFRRVSVAAERYNPEDDDDSDDEQASVYPKTDEQRQRLKDAVIHNLLFRTLEAKQIDQVLDAMWEKNVEKGETIIKQGDDGDHFYVIDHGIYEIYVSKEVNFLNPVKVGEYNQTGSFGELALMYNQPRSATIVASTDGVLWVMGRHTFRKLVLKHAFRKRQMYEKFLKDLDILQSLTDYERSNVADALIPVEYAQDEIIIRQGDEGDRMFFIEDGFCDIYMNGNFHKRLSKGEYFGELALLNHEPRSATVTAASLKVRLASLEVESFERLLGPCMDLIHRNTSKYLKST